MLALPHETGRTAKCICVSLAIEAGSSSTTDPSAR